MKICFNCQYWKEESEGEISFCPTFGLDLCLRHHTEAHGRGDYGVAVNKFQC